GQARIHDRVVVVVQAKIRARVVVEADRVTQLVRDNGLIIVLVGRNQAGIRTGIPVPALDDVDRRVAAELQVWIAIIRLVAGARSVHHFGITEYAVWLPAEQGGRHVLHDDLGL